MKKSRFTVQQIVGVLKQAEAGMPVKELCRKLGISDATFYNWKAKYGGLSVSELKRLREPFSQVTIGPNNLGRSNSHAEKNSRHFSIYGWSSEPRAFISRSSSVRAIPLAFAWQEM